MSTEFPRPLLFPSDPEGDRLDQSPSSNGEARQVHGFSVSEEPALPTNQWQLDVIGGLTTFLTMSYIIVVNPSILKDAGIPFSAALTATVLLSASMTLLMGLYAKLPFGVAPGMGINAFFTYGLCLGENIPWSQALGITFWSGVVFLILSVFRVREAIVTAIPSHLRSAAAAGIGLFLLLLGLKAGGFVSANEATLIGRAPLSEQSALAALGLLIIVVLIIRKNPFAMLVGIAVVTLVASLRGLVDVPRQMLSYPDFSIIGAAEIFGSLNVVFIGALFGLLFTDLFDSISTFCGVAQAGGLLDKHGQPKRLREGLIVDATATMCAGLLGTSSGTAYIESAAGIKAGARTGLASVVTGLLFLPCLFIGPLVGMIPGYATAPVLIVVGVLMTATLTEMNLKEEDELCLERVIPVGLILGAIPLTFSITQGITLGFVAHTVCYIAAGKWRSVHPMMWAISAVSTWVLVSA